MIRTARQCKGVRLVRAGNQGHRAPNQLGGPQGGETSTTKERAAVHVPSGGGEIAPADVTCVDDAYPALPPAPLLASGRAVRWPRGPRTAQRP